MRETIFCSDCGMSIFKNESRYITPNRKVCKICYSLFMNQN